MVQQRIINESSMKHQWNINDSGGNKTKTMNIKMVSIEFIKVSNTSLQSIINDHRRSINEPSRFRRLGQKKTFLIFKTCYKILAVPSMVFQKIINETSMKQQKSVSDSEVNTTKTTKIKKVSIEIINVSNMSPKGHQRIIEEAAMKHQCFGEFHNKRIFINNLCVEVIKVSWTFIQKIVNND